MKIPLLLQGCILILWGWQFDFLLLSIPLALLLEARFWIPHRWEVSQKDFYRLNDLTTLVIIGASFYFYNFDKSQLFLFSVIEVSPLIFYPFMLIFSFSTRKTLSIDVIFFSLRSKVTTKPSELDFPSIYLILCLIAMATQTALSPYYFTFIVGVIGILLLANKPKRHGVLLWCIIFAASSAAGFSLQFGIKHTSKIVREKSIDWFLQNDVFDVFEVQTSLGRVGSLKLSDQILFRVKSKAPVFLQLASYDQSVGTSWVMSDRTFASTPRQSKSQWRWDSGEAKSRLTIYPESDKPKALIPTPQQAIGLNEFTAVTVEKSRFGVVQADGIESTPSYDIILGDDNVINGPPKESDTKVSPHKTTLLESVLPKDFLQSDNPNDVVGKIYRYFSDFRYTLYQPPSDNIEPPLSFFLTQRHAGHCEYFATATVWMLRYAGIPARYVTGFSVQEYDPFTGLYLVRKRHAHAWAVAYIDQQWRIIDTTPSIWLEEEAAQAPSLQPLFDFISNSFFQIKQYWYSLTDATRTWTLMAALFATLSYLALRLILEGKLTIKPRKKKRKQKSLEDISAPESPFYEIEHYLVKEGYSRQQGEPLRFWLDRIKRPDLVSLLDLHYRLRFDPAGLSNAQETELLSKVEKWLATEKE